MWIIYDHYLYALIVIIGTLVTLIVIQWFIQFSHWSSWALSLQGIAPPLINVISVLFALTLAFLANDTWLAHDRVTKTVYKEADSLRAVDTLTRQLPTQQQAQVTQAVHAYAGAVANEWADLARRQTSSAVKTQSDALFNILSSPTSSQSLGSTMQALLLKKMDESCKERDQRVALSQTHVNPLKLLGMGFLKLLTLISVGIVHIDKPRAAFVAMLLLALSAAPKAAIVLIQSNPFQQPTFVPSLPILNIFGSTQSNKHTISKYAP